VQLALFFLKLFFLDSSMILTFQQIELANKLLHS
jgi:hypothetical protein